MHHLNLLINMLSLPLVIHLNTHSNYNTTTTNNTNTTNTNNTTTTNTTNSVAITADSNWSVYEDWPGKPGFISTTVGSAFQISIPQSVVYAHLKSGHIHVEVLKSYEHVGMVKVSIGIHTTQPVYNPTETVYTYYKLDQRVIDCIWADRSSQRATVEIRVKVKDVYKQMPLPSHTTTSSTSSHSKSHTVPTHMSTTHHPSPTTSLTSSSTLVLEFEVLPSIPVRSSNKVKLFGLLLILSTVYWVESSNF